MTDTLTAAVVHIDRPEVQLTIARTDTAAPLEIYRTDHSGTRRVRMQEGYDVARSTVIFTDYEPALGDVTYFVPGGSTIAADLTKFKLPTFSLPYAPVVLRIVPTVTVFEGTRTSPGTAQDVIGRRFKVGNLQPLGGREGRMECIVRSWAEAKALESLLELGQIVHYREADNPGMDVFMGVTTAAVRPAGSLWRVEIGWIEFDAPTRPYRTWDWTFQALKDQGGTFARAATDYVTFSDMASGGRL